MRKNLHHKIMLSILAGSLALGFVYAPPAFAEDAVDVEIADGEEYNLNADYTISGTDYNDASITLPTGPIGTFTVTAGNGGLPLTDRSTGGKGGDGLVAAMPAMAAQAAMAAMPAMAAMATQAAMAAL